MQNPKLLFLDEFYRSHRTRLVVCPHVSLVVVVFVGGWQNDTLDFKSKTQHTLITRHASQDGRQS